MISDAQVITMFPSSINMKLRPKILISNPHRIVSNTLIWGNGNPTRRHKLKVAPTGARPILITSESGRYMEDAART